MGLITKTFETLEKLNRAQPSLSNNGTSEASSGSPAFTYQQMYEQLEVVNRAVNMIVDDVSAIKTKIGDSLSLASSQTGARKKSLDKLLNKEPNPFQDIDSFKRTLIMDLILDGNIFIYYDGAHMYHLPAVKMTVVSDEKNFVNHYRFDGGEEFKPSEIIHIKDNSYKSIYRGTSRLEPALRTMRIIIEMRTFQDNFFRNGAIPGLVLMSENTLNDRLKKKLTDEWAKKYNPSKGGRRPIILDGGLKIDQVASNFSYKDLDFQASIQQCEETVLKALGVPPILLDTGNNANLRPNHRLFYLETIIPIVNKINAALEKFFGFEIYEDTTYIEALRPELQDQASYLQTLVNGGVITPNEARLELGKDPDPDPESNKLRIPANIAGSAANPSEGGRPKESNGKSI
ncbi:MAG: phage portal protein [Hymenobacter sp.]|nr:MAG: phage portal protein [Hymenobacter sp.]